MKAALISGDTTCDIFEGSNPVLRAKNLKNSIEKDFPNRKFVIVADNEATER